MNINGGFRKDMAYYDIKGHKKAGLLLLPRNCIFRKPAKGGQIAPTLPEPF